MSISMTEFAIERISSMIDRGQMNRDDTYLRVGLRSGGCSGYSYIFELTNKHEEHDKVFEFGSVKICVDRKSYLFLNGMEIDYEESPFKSGIKINNPMASRTCGCGESIAF
jgi:iron-sulfur cluster assembly protein